MSAPIFVAGRECRFVQSDHDDTLWAICTATSSNTFLRDDGQWIEWMHAPPKVRFELRRFQWKGREAAREFASSLAARSQPAEDGWPRIVGCGVPSRHVELEAFGDKLLLVKGASGRWSIVEQSALPTLPQEPDRT